MGNHDVVLVTIFSNYWPQIDSAMLRTMLI